MNSKNNSKNMTRIMTWTCCFMICVSSSAIADYHDKSARSSTNNQPHPRAVIGRILRNGFTRWPSSIAPSETSTVYATVSNTIPNHNYDFSFEIIGGGSDNGTASILHGSPHADNHGNVIIPLQVAGGSQTNVGHSGHLKVRALSSNIPIGTSPGFTICAHPYLFTKTMDVDYGQQGAGKLGILADVACLSDGGGEISQLNEVEISEQIAGSTTHPTSKPPFADDYPLEVGTWVPASDPNLHDRMQTDVQHIDISTDREGTKTTNQLVIFKCKRCGVSHVVILRSGFEIWERIAYHGGFVSAYRYKMHNVPNSTSVNGYIANAGGGDFESEWVTVH